MFASRFKEQLRQISLVKYASRRLPGCHALPQVVPSKAAVQRNTPRERRLSLPQHLPACDCQARSSGHGECAPAKIPSWGNGLEIISNEIGSRVQLSARYPTVAPRNSELSSKDIQTRRCGSCCPFRCGYPAEPSLGRIHSQPIPKPTMRPCSPSWETLLWPLSTIEWEYSALYTLEMTECLEVGVACFRSLFRSGSMEELSECCTTCPTTSILTTAPPWPFWGMWLWWPSTTEWVCLVPSTQEMPGFQEVLSLEPQVTHFLFGGATGRNANVCAN